MPPALRPTSYPGGLWILYGFGIFSLSGFAVFGLHPELLSRIPRFASLYGFAFRFFAVGHVWLAAGVMGLFLIRRVGRRWLPAFAALYLISLASELLGTGYGIPFGHYRYSELLSPMWLDRVPVIIPLSWFFMAVPSYAVARAALPEPDQRTLRIGLGSAILLSWDLSLDPAMSHVTRYWVWGEPGAYYGMPWLNLFGWYVTGAALLAALALLHADRWIAELPLRWLLGFYAANLLLPLGMNAVAGLWGAVAATLLALGATGGAALALARHRELDSAAAGARTARSSDLAKDL